MVITFFPWILPCRQIKYKVHAFGLILEEADFRIIVTTLLVDGPFTGQTFDTDMSQD